MQKSLLSAEIQFMLRKKAAAKPFLAASRGQGRALRGAGAARSQGEEPGGARGSDGPAWSRTSWCQPRWEASGGRTGAQHLSPRCQNACTRLAACARWRGSGGTWGPVPRAAVEVRGSPHARWAPDPAGELCLGFATSKALRGLSGRIREGRRGPGGEGRSRLQAAPPEVAFQQMEERSRRCSRCCLRRM